jgi:dienelactone hydrolase
MLESRFIRPNLWPSLVCAALLLAAAGQSAPAQSSPYSTVARNTFADLLKIPAEPPQVEVTVHGTQEDEGLVTEDVSWTSLDGEIVPAFVIRPAKAAGRLPAVVCLHGSSGSRESMSTKEFVIGPWQRPGGGEPHDRLLGWARELARRGYIALAITQRGLDSRTPAINTQSNALLVQGRTGMGAVLYEIRQGLTYLGKRPDVDASRIGMTGLSFGGITTFYTWLLDGRVAAAAPICGGVGSIAMFIEQGSLGYHGTYWWIPGMLEKGDQADFAAAMAPRPLMVWGPTEDIAMPKAAVDRFASIVRPAYERAGKPEAFVLHQQPGEHGFSMEAFDAVIEFFGVYLKP